MGRPPGALAQSANLVNRASSPNTFAGHGPLARSVFWCSGPGLRVVSRASSPNTLAGQTPPLVTKLRRHFSEELFLTWALLGFAPQCSGPGVNSSLCEEWCSWVQKLYVVHITLGLLVFLVYRFEAGFHSKLCIDSIQKPELL